MTIQPVNAGTFTTCLEHLQIGYVYSVAAAAGCTVEVLRNDRYGADLDITQSQPNAEELTLGLQLKCTTSTTPDPTKNHFSYQFRHRSHFDKLAKVRDSKKLLLAVMTAPAAQASWTVASHEHLRVFRGCYWVNLEGATAAAQQPTVQVPISNLLTPVSLLGIFDRWSNGVRL